MSFNPNIPVITDPIVQSSSQIRANFQVINNAFADNHVGLTQDTNFAGMHNNLTMQPSADPLTSATQIAIYNKLDSNLIPQLFFRASANGNIIQMTGPNLKTGQDTLTPITYFPEQYSFIAGPFTIYGGILKNPATGFVKNLTPTTTLLYVDLIAANSSKKQTSYVIPTNVSGSSFTVTYQASWTFSLLFCMI